MRDDIKEQHDIQYFECECFTQEHTIRFHLDADPEWPELFVTVHLDADGWWCRAWAGLKYIFGHKSLYGHFNTWIMQPEDADRLNLLLTKYRQTEELKQMRETGK